MTGESPYPGVQRPYSEDFRNRISTLESRVAVAEEWRRSIDSWRGTLEQEGVAKALGIQSLQLSYLRDEIVSLRTDQTRLKDALESLESAEERRSGWLQGYRLLFIIVPPALLAILALVQLFSGS